MNAIRILGILVLGLSYACAQERPVKLSADAFEEKIQTLADEQLVDVRTPDEFKKGHLKDALNADINSGEFKNMIASLDKSKPVLVYCLSGGRSAKAAEYMRSNGYQVYELEGGIVKWNSENKPVEAAAVNTPGMSLQEFRSKLKSDKIVLVDVHARWCAPCIKMAPWIEEIAARYPDKLSVLKINADENSVLLKELNIDALPTLYLFKSEKQTWTHTGFLEKEKLESSVKQSLGL
jgi:thioredoxin